MPEPMPMPMPINRRRIIVAVNPEASFGKRREIGPRVIQTLRDAGHDVTALSEPNYELLRREVSRAVGEGTDALVVVGGDGMVSLGTNIVAESGTPLGIVPTGTGNDTARGLGLPFEDADAAIAALLDALDRPARVIDAGRVRHGELSTWFACVLSAGFDAIVNDRTNRMTRPRGASRYIVAVLRELLTFKPIEYTIVADGVEQATRAMLVSVANNKSVGGGMQITPDAEVDDGLLDLFIVTPMNKLKFLRLFPKVFSGTHTGLEQVKITRVKSVSLQAAGVVAYADGERVGQLPVDVEVVPGALHVLV